MNKSRMDLRAKAQTMAIERLNTRRAIDSDLLAWASCTAGRGLSLLEARLRAGR